MNDPEDIQDFLERAETHLIRAQTEITRGLEIIKTHTSNIAIARNKIYDKINNIMSSPGPIIFNKDHKYILDQLQEIKFNEISIHQVIKGADLES